MIRITYDYGWLLDWYDWDSMMWLKQNKNTESAVLTPPNNYLWFPISKCATETNGWVSCVENFLSGKDLALWQLLRHGCLSGSGFMKKHMWVSSCTYTDATNNYIGFFLHWFRGLNGLELSFFKGLVSKQNAALIDLDPKSCLDQ